MARYIKFDSQGKNAYEAPEKIQRDGKTIIGYNKSTNEAMLLGDGWLRYDGGRPLSQLILNDGNIEEIIVQPELPTKFTKLAIRRCLRKNGLEDRLDEVLSSNFAFKAEWDDAIQIDVNDVFIQQAVSQGLITQDLISLVQHGCEEDLA